MPLTSSATPNAAHHGAYRLISTLVRAFVAPWKISSNLYFPALTVLGSFHLSMLVPAFAELPGQRLLAFELRLQTAAFVTAYRIFNFFPASALCAQAPTAESVGDAGRARGPGGPVGPVSPGGRSVPEARSAPDPSVQADR